MRSTLAVLCMLLLVPALSADGLVYQLPPDGVWARYAGQTKVVFAEDKGKDQKPLEISLTVASVGQEMVTGEPCRWLEFVAEVKQPDGKLAVIQVLKILIPEKRLRAGETPLDHWVKGWTLDKDGPPQALTKELLASPAGAMLYLFLASPLQQAKPLPEKSMETKLGKLACVGTSGVITIKKVSVKHDHVVRVQAYRHAKAPFGGVQLHLVIVFPDQSGSAEMLYTLADVGDGAKSLLPEQK